MWPSRRTHVVFDDGNYAQEMDTEPELPKRREKARRLVNLFIDGEAGVDRDASNDEGSDDEYDDLDGFIVDDDIEF